MSAAENLYDNAFMESCSGMVKTELELVEYTNATIATQALRELSAYVRYYNAARRHSSLSYAIPLEFECQPSPSSQTTVQK